MFKMNIWTMIFGITALGTVSAIAKYAADKRSETAIRRAEIKAGVENKPKVEIIEEEKK